MYNKRLRILFCVLVSFLQICLLFTLAESLVRNRLDDFIQHYELLDYNPVQVQNSQNRHRRWIGENELESDEVQIKFISHGKHFNLRLKRDTQIFDKSIQIEIGNNTSWTLNSNNLLEGYLEDDLDSKVFGSIHDGIFHGHIFTPNESFSIERISRFSVLNDRNDSVIKNTSHHSVIYSHNDIDHTNMKGENQHNGCGVSEDVLEWMSKIQNSRIIEEDAILEQTRYYENPDSTTIFKSNVSMLQNLIDESRHKNNNYWQESVRQRRSILDGKLAYRSSRNTSPLMRTTCSLYIRTDPTLWRQIEKQEGVSDREKIREIIISMIGQHVKAVNDIFENTLFRADNLTFRNIRFEVQKIKIDTYDECEPTYKGTPNPFCEDHIDVSNFLDMHSRNNHESYCLSYMLTYRDFTGGVVGLAWVGSTTSGGGICQKFTNYLEGSMLKNRSLNTGIVTFLNYNRQLPPRLSHLTFAHEIGHNFGAPHDPDECQPGGNPGNFIMYASSTNGYLDNNAKFSQCSINDIVKVLNQVFNTNQKENCFIVNGGAFCGNHLVEEDEECDCGVEGECTDECCYPRTTSRNRCTRKPHAICSPSEGPCCQPETCGFIKGEEGILCQRENECSEESFCDGTSAQCPPPASKPDNTVCNNGTQVCLEGECKGSICDRWGMKECYLSSVDYISDKRALCNVSCADSSEVCKSTYDLNIPGLSRTLSLRPGTPCDNFKGYCDVFMKCRGVDEEGPLLRLKRLIFNKERFRTLYQRAIEKWWLVLLGSIAFIILMALFIKCCAVHTPSSNPYMPKNLKFSETIRRPMNSLKRQPKPARLDPNFGESYPLRDNH